MFKVKMKVKVFNNTKFVLSLREVKIKLLWNAIIHIKV